MLPMKLQATMLITKANITDKGTETAGVNKF